jgi:hypothetical protein
MLLDLLLDTVIRAVFTSSIAQMATTRFNVPENFKEDLWFSFEI